MLRLFGGMIIGSMMTLILLGGPTAADQLLVHAKTSVVQQYTQPDPMVTIVLLLSLGLSLAGFAVWHMKQMKNTAMVVNKLRRFCS